MLFKSDANTTVAPASSTLTRETHGTQAAFDRQTKERHAKVRPRSCCYYTYRMPRKLARDTHGAYNTVGLAKNVTVARSATTCGNDTQRANPCVHFLLLHELVLVNTPLSIRTQHGFAELLLRLVRRDDHTFVRLDVEAGRSSHDQPQHLMAANTRRDACQGQRRKRHKVQR